MGFDIEVPANVAEALDQDSFDVLDFVRGAALPKDEVTIYTNREAGFELKRLYQAEQAAAESTDTLSLDDESYTIDEDRITELTEAVKASALTFELRGIAPKAVDVIRQHLKATIESYSEKNGADNSEFDLAFGSTIIAKSIQGVRNARGQRSATVWTVDKIKELSIEIPDDEFSKLLTAAFELTFAVNLFDGLVDADFS